MKQLSVIGLFGLYFTCLLQGASAVLGPAVAGLSETLNMDPNIVAQVGTFGAIFGIASSFLAGRFSGTKIKYKTFIVLSLFIFVVGGSIPALIFTWPVILFSRACVGFGVGVFYALPPALLMKYFEGDLQPKKLGMANAFGSAGGLIMQFVVGVLVDIEPRYVFGIFTIGLIALVLIVWGMKEPEDSIGAGGISDQPKARVKIPAPAITNILLFFVAVVLWMPSILFVSVIVVSRGLGTGVHAGTVAIMFNVASILLSLSFSFLYKTFRKFLIIIVLALVTVGMILEYNATTLFMAGAGLLLTGALGVMVPTLLSDNSKHLTPESVTFATSLLIIAMNLAGFAAGPFVQIAASLGKDIFLPGLYFGIFGEAALVVIFLIIRLFQKDKPVIQAA